MNLRIAIMTDDAGWHGVRLRDAFVAHGCSVHFASLRECRLDLADTAVPVRVPGFETRLPDGVFVRGVPGGSLEEVIFYLDVLHALREVGVPVYNDARAIERSVDKGMTSLLLARSGVATPPTWVCADRVQAWARVMHETANGHEVVCKPLFGAQGDGLMRLGRGDGLPDAERYNGIFYLQRYIDSGEGTWHDWRVFVINGRAVAAMRRNGRSWINNAAQGARCQAALLHPELRELGECAAAALEMSYAGVDIVRDAGGRHWVLEVNGIPAWRALQTVCNVNIADLLVVDFLDRLRGSLREVVT